MMRDFLIKVSVSFVSWFSLIGLTYIFKDIHFKNSTSETIMKIISIVEVVCISIILIVVNIVMWRN